MIKFDGIMELVSCADHVGCLMPLLELQLFGLGVNGLRQGVCGQRRLLYLLALTLRFRLDRQRSLLWFVGDVCLSWLRCLHSRLWLIFHLWFRLNLSGRGILGRRNIDRPDGNGFFLTRLGAFGLRRRDSAAFNRLVGNGLQNLGELLYWRGAYLGTACPVGKRRGSPAYAPGYWLLVDNTLWRDLAEHLHRIKPGFDALESDLVINRGNSHPLDVD